MPQLKHLWRMFMARAHVLGAIYYAWFFLSAFAGIAYSGYKLLITPEITGVSEILFLIFVFLLICVLALVPLLVAVVIERTNLQRTVVTNPNLSITSRQVEYTVSRTSLRKRQVLQLLAHGPATCFRFALTLSGHGKSSVVPRGNGVTVLGPIARGSSDSYELEFPRPLQDGQSIEIEFDIDVDDPKSTMRPYLTDLFHNAISYGVYKATYSFYEKPLNVFAERLSVTGASLSNIQQLLPKRVSNGFVYEVTAPHVEQHCSYTVSWVWA